MLATVFHVFKTGGACWMPSKLGIAPNCDIFMFCNLVVLFSRRLAVQCTIIPPNNIATLSYEPGIAIYDCVKTNSRLLAQNHSEKVVHYRYCSSVTPT